MRQYKLEIQGKDGKWYRVIGTNLVNSDSHTLNEIAVEHSDMFGTKYYKYTGDLLTLKDFKKLFVELTENSFDSK